MEISVYINLSQTRSVAGKNNFAFETLRELGTSFSSLEIKKKRVFKYVKPLVIEQDFISLFWQTQKESTH